MSELLDPALQPEAWLEAHYPELEKVVQHLCDRKRVWGDEADEFHSLARLHFVERDYAVIRELGQVQSVQSYLYAVLSRLLVDYIRQRKGRFRPSRKAEGLGETAMLLERLVVEQRLTLEETFQSLTITHQRPLTRQEFQELCRSLDLQRGRPEVQGLEEPELLPASEASTEELAFVSPRVLLEPALAELEHLKEGLSPEDQLLLEWRFRDQLSISEIARVLKLSRYHAENTLQRLLLRLRERLLEQGLDEDRLRLLLRLLG